MGKIMYMDKEYGGSGGGLPSGGTAGQYLVKQSATEGDADWETPPGGGDFGGLSIVDGAINQTFVSPYPYLDEE